MQQLRAKYVSFLSESYAHICYMA